MFWFIINFVNVYDNDYLEIVEFFTTPVSKFLFSLFIIFAYFFSSLTISEVFEDYIADDKIKYVANRLLFISAIIIPLINNYFIN
jgi:succinate dehydrogenase / fumarate reductase membrane anchor subunit